MSVSTELKVQIIGIALATIVPLIVLSVTLYFHTKAQQKSNNMQSALKWQENTNTEISRSRQNITEAYNQIDHLLFLCSNFPMRNLDFTEYIKQVEAIYVLYNQSINNIRFNTNLFTYSKWCEGCTLCDIKMTGDLTKATIQLQAIFLAIDEEVREALNSLLTALSTVMDSIDLAGQKETLEKINNGYQALIANFESITYRDLTEEEMQHINKGKADIPLNDGSIAKIISTIDSNKALIAQKSDAARNRIETIYSKYKPKLDDAVFTYFRVYIDYSKQGASIIQKKGNLNSACRKTSNDNRRRKMPS